MHDLGFAMFMTLGMVLIVLIPLGMVALMLEPDVRKKLEWEDAVRRAREARAEYVKRNGLAGEGWDNWVQCGNWGCGR